MNDQWIAGCSRSICTECTDKGTVGTNLKVNRSLKRYSKEVGLPLGW